MRSVVVIVVALVTFPAFAQRRIDVFIDGEAVRRTGNVTSFSTGTRFEPSFRSGGGIGGGFNLFVSNRLSFEAKVAALATKARLRVGRNAFLPLADLCSA